MRSLPIFLLILCTTAALAQQRDTLNLKAEPVGGTASLAIIYYRIDFTPEETEYLRTHEAELIFSVTYQGKAKLEKVNDIEMRSVIDSMMRVNDRLPDFYPETANGKAQNGIYFMKLSWPNYEFPLQPQQKQIPYTMPSAMPMPLTNYYNRPKLDEFEYITYRRVRFDMLIGGAFNTFNGNLSRYFQNGGGLKMEYCYYGKKGWGGGLITDFYLNKPKTQLPVFGGGRQPNTNQFLYFIGLNVGKIFMRSDWGNVGIQAELCYSIFSLAAVDQSFGGTTSIAMGYVPGAKLFYMMPLGKGRMQGYYFPSAYRSYLCFHFGMRSLKMNVKEANGVMLDAGVSYRFVMRQVLDYKRK